MKKAGFIIMPGIVALLMLLPIGCAREDTNRLYPFRWQASGDSVFDSLTTKIDVAFFRRLPADSIEKLYNSLEALVGKEDADSVKGWRRQYFQAIITMRKGNRKACDSLLQNAREKIDSAAYPYDVRRIDYWFKDATMPAEGIEAYRHSLRNVSFADSIGDAFLSGAAYGSLGVVLNNAGDIDGAKAAVRKSQQMFEKAGFPVYAIGNRINLAKAFKNAGRRDEAVKMLKEVLSDPVTLRDTACLVTVWRNLYLWTGDTIALSRAGRLTKECRNPALRPNLAIIGMYSAQELMKRNEIAKADEASSEAMKYFDYLRRDTERADALQTRGRILVSMGSIAEGCELLDSGARMVQRIYEENGSKSVAAASCARDIAAERMHIEMERHRSAMISVCIVACVIIVLLVAIGLFYRRMQIQKLRLAQSRLRLERMQRKLLATQLAIQETDTIFESVGSEIDNLKEKKEISTAADSRLKGTLKAKALATGSRESFIDTFTAINPEFNKRLKEAYPDMTASDLKLAAFIAVGLDTKHISRILAIRPESVKQGRWRIRTKMGLDKSDSLEEVISTYLNTPYE